MRLWLEQIWEYAVNKDWDNVREILNRKIFTYRQAQLYCENVKKDYAASKFILKQAMCKCGGIVTEWKHRTTPKCSSCLFRESLSKIEYGEIRKSTHH